MERFLSEDKCEPSERQCHQAALTEGLLNALFCASLAHCTPVRPASARFWVPDTDMRSQGEGVGARLALSAEDCGHFYPSKQTSRQCFTSLGGQWFPSKERIAIKAALRRCCTQSPGDASWLLRQYLVPLRTFYTGAIASLFTKKLFSALMKQCVVAVVVLCAMRQQPSRRMMKRLCCLCDAAGKINESN